jgi:hypothetical protein
MPDHNTGLSIEVREPGNDGGVIAEPSVAMNLGKLSEDSFDVIERVGPVRVAGEFDPLPGSGERWIGC